MGTHSPADAWRCSASPLFECSVTPSSSALPAVRWRSALGKRCSGTNQHHHWAEPLPSHITNGGFWQTELVLTHEFLFMTLEWVTLAHHIRLFAIRLLALTAQTWLGSSGCWVLLIDGFLILKVQSLSLWCFILCKCRVKAVKAIRYWATSHI